MVRAAFGKEACLVWKAGFLVPLLARVRQRGRPREWPDNVCERSLRRLWRCERGLTDGVVKGGVSERASFFTPPRRRLCVNYG